MYFESMHVITAFPPRVQGSAGLVLIIDRADIGQACKICLRLVNGNVILLHRLMKHELTNSHSLLVSLLTTVLHSLLLRYT